MLLRTFWMFLLPMLTILVPLWMGQTYARYLKKRLSEIPDTPIGSAVNAALGLLAFMLAFTFQLTGDRFEKRKELLLEEVSYMRISYLNAGLVPDPVRTQARKYIKDYVDLRSDLARDNTKLDFTTKQSRVMLDSLWSYCELLSSQDRSSESYSLFFGSVSEMIRLFNDRINIVFHYRMPEAVIWVLCFVSFFSMLIMGFQFGASGELNWLMVLFMAIVFAAVMWLIFALDRPEMGYVKADPAPLFELQRQLHGN